MICTDIFLCDGQSASNVPSVFCSWAKDESTSLFPSIPGFPGVGDALGASAKKGPEVIGIALTGM